MKKESKSWFEQMFLSWEGCPALEGECETTCHTEEGNNLILYITTTKVLNEKYHKIFCSTWNHFSKDLGKLNNLFDPKGLPDYYQYDVLNTGIAVPTYLGRFTYGRVVSLYKLAINMYYKEMGEKLEKNNETIRDVQNWILREFNVWLNENKRYHEPNQ